MWQKLFWINIYHCNSVISDFRNELPIETSELLFGHKNVSKKIVKSHKSKCHYRKLFLPHIVLHPVQNSLWKKKNRASDIEGKFHAILKCRIWIYHQKLFSSLDIRVSVHFGIYLEKWAIFWLFLRSSVLATSGYTTHFPCVLGCNQMWPGLKISKIAKK